MRILLFTVFYKSYFGNLLEFLATLADHLTCFSGCVIDLYGKMKLQLSSLELLQINVMWWFSSRLDVKYRTFKAW